MEVKFGGQLWWETQGSRLSRISEAASRLKRSLNAMIGIGGKSRVDEEGALAEQRNNDLRRANHLHFATSKNAQPCGITRIYGVLNRDWGC